MKIHYEKFKELPKDALGFPSLVIRITLLVVMLVLSGYIFWGFD